MPVTIWKAVIARDDYSFDAPKGAELLTAREQGRDICVWFRCDPTEPKEARRVEVSGTGWDNAPTGRYVGSAHLDGGALVFHVFEPQEG
jgi:hypothetical protein